MCAQHFIKRTQSARGQDVKRTIQLTSLKQGLLNLFNYINILTCAKKESMPSLNLSHPWTSVGAKLNKVKGEGVPGEESKLPDEQSNVLGVESNFQKEGRKQPRFISCALS